MGRPSRIVREADAPKKGGLMEKMTNPTCTLVAGLLVGIIVWESIDTDAHHLDHTVETTEADLLHAMPQQPVTQITGSAWRM